LFKDSKSLEAATKACAGLARKQRQALEEYGVSVAYLAAGLASWNPDGTSALNDPSQEDTSAQGQGVESGSSQSTKPKYTRPSAPVLLRAVQIERRRGAQESWTLRLTEDFQLNGVFQHVLNNDSFRLNDDKILGLDEYSLESTTAMLEAVRKACQDVPEFAIRPDIFIGAFSYQKQSMVSDVDDLEALSDSELIRALAGELDAVDNLRTEFGDFNESTPDYAPVESDFLILDADASQSYVVNAVCAGRNLVIEGPPGTGKSQTIANTIAALIAEGKHVLFVAQKRAAVEAVLDRLDQAGLDHLVLGAFSSSNSRRFVAEELRSAIDGQRTSGIPQVSELHYELESSRDTLVTHKDALFEESQGWGVSIYEIRTQLLGISEDNKTTLRLNSEVFSDWDETSLATIGSAFSELVSLGALSPEWNMTRGWDPEKVVSKDDLQFVTNQVRDIQAKLLPIALKSFQALTRDVDRLEMHTWQSAHQLLEDLALGREVEAKARGLLSEEQSAEHLTRMRVAFDRGYRKQVDIKLSWSERRKLKKQISEICAVVPKADRRLLLEQVERLWKSASPGCSPAPPASFELAKSSWENLEVGLIDLNHFLRGMDLMGDSLLNEISPALQSLGDDKTKAKMPRAFELRTYLEELDLEPLIHLVEDSLANEEHLQDFEVSQVLRWVVLNSLLEDALIEKPELAHWTGKELNDATRSFRIADESHLRANSARIRRIAAANLKQALDAHVDEHAIVKTEVTRKRNFRTVRALMSEAPNVMLAAKPVWAMSPLAVSQLLPNYAMFDVVIFDEASQVKPADAIPSLMRAVQVVVAGDSKQLPPSEFFTKVLEDQSPNEVEEDEVLSDAVGQTNRLEPRSSRESFTRDAESILFAMDRVLAGQSRRLLWHYRSRDERLIAVSNAHVYDSSLITFPAADSPDSIRHEVVPYSRGISGKTLSPEAEVEKVVALVKEHFSKRPAESLGVITFGVKHQYRIEAAIDAEAAKDPKLAEAISDKKDEPFFVKSIERVQGDERDAIILSVGYGKDTDGKLKYFWGPLLQEGGERRLNVAISRAKRRMTFVTSFSADDVPDDGHHSAGFKLMYRFLRFMATDGQELSGGSDRTIPLNPFEIDVRDRLQARGLELDPQVGVGSYRIDFAVRHPKKKGKYVLAIEADGASYHSGQTARERDRLRQVLLERRGWTFHRIWSTDWFNNAESEVEKVLAAFQAALNVKGAPEASEELPKKENWHVESSERKLSLPVFRKGLPIAEYSDATLNQLVAYVRSDGVIRSRDDEVEELFALLGYKRRGPKIVERLTKAVVRSDPGRS
jgi:very-short-patch-repair endonuclease